MKPDCVPRNWNSLCAETNRTRQEGRVTWRKNMKTQTKRYENKIKIIVVDQFTANFPQYIRWWCGFCWVSVPLLVCLCVCGHHKIELMVISDFEIEFFYLHHFSWIFLRGYLRLSTMPYKYIAQKGSPAIFIMYTVFCVCKMKKSREFWENIITLTVPMLSAAAHSKTNWHCVSWFG